MNPQLGLRFGIAGLATGLATVAATAYTRLQGPFGVNEDEHPFKNNALLAGDEARLVALCGLVAGAILSLAGILMARSAGAGRSSPAIRRGLAGLVVALGLLVWTAVTWVKDSIDYIISF